MNQDATQRSSSPKIIPLCPGLIDRMVFNQKSEMGRVFEATVGARLLQVFHNLSYWREGDYEVDYVVNMESDLVAIEVKSGRSKKSKSLSVFLKKYPRGKIVFISTDNFEKFDRDPELFIKELIN